MAKKILKTLVNNLGFKILAVVLAFILWLVVYNKMCIRDSYTPKGHYIHGKGIQPDIKLEYKYSGPEDESYDMRCV